MGPGRHIVSYPLRGGSLVNLVMVHERSLWAGEGWSHRDDPAHVRAAFAGFGGLAHVLLNALSEVYLWGLFRHPVAECWFQDRSVLIGDAAHPMLPFLAQGANMALEDALGVEPGIASSWCNAARLSALSVFAASPREKGCCNSPKQCPQLSSQCPADPVGRA